LAGSWSVGRCRYIKTHTGGKGEGEARTNVNVPMPQPTTGKTNQGGRKRWMPLARKHRTLLFG
jgi:hypothetical protein